jgi:MoaA/NifB/PqqE/SkfB family radical SAM enzyme
MCYNGSGARRGPNVGGELSSRDLLLAARKLAQVQPLSVCLSGGDALLHEAYFECARYLRGQGITVNTITNGWLVSERVAHTMADLFSVVQVSVDGACAETHDAVRGHAGSYDRAIRAIRLLTQRAVDVYVAFTPTRRSVAEFPALVDAMSTIEGVKGVSTTYVVPAGRAYGNRQMPSTVQQETLREQLEGLRVRYPGLSLSFVDPLASFIKQHDRFLPNPSLCIAPNGDLRVSPWFAITFGNILRDEIDDVWRSRLSLVWRDPAFRDYVRSVRSTAAVATQPRVPWVDEPLRYEELLSCAHVQPLKGGG